MARRKEKYTILGFLFDLFMFFITCGVPWLIWIFVRESRMRNR